ncbi:Muramidase-2 precursor [Lacunisphaera limnophila]|uniref:Muramidase-2 n=1 Tax=Lacunisphaera limnophila TaxID=1838286 RepID=A0A1D8AZT6_9BACT|nr:LysM peptidoglycan-binding domain-containing protein [Lacunisphaera limnophila]AOS46408.1 Muramidase-2 precursor [Lacunisphaera limnophila]
MKILQIFGAVVAVHLLAFIFIFASPGCQSGPRNLPTPDATVPDARAAAPITYGSPATPEPVDLGTMPVSYTPASPLGHASPTRPGSAAAVTVTPPKPVENVAPVSTYTVERGDSLWSISKKHGLTVAELAKANSLASGVALKPGRKLIIPGKPGAAVATAVPPAAMSLPAEKTPVPVRPTSGESVTHTVVVGESLGVIARKYQVSVGELAAANNITDPSKVRAGQQLVIPGFKAVGSKSAPAAVRPAADKPAAPAPAEAAPAPVVNAPRFEIAPPPPGQDLDAGLKEADTEVPTIKVEEPVPANGG